MSRCFIGKAIPDQPGAQTKSAHVLTPRGTVPKHTWIIAHALPPLSLTHTYQELTHTGVKKRGNQDGLTYVNTST